MLLAIAQDDEVDFVADLGVGTRKVAEGQLAEERVIKLPVLVDRFSCHGEDDVSALEAGLVRRAAGADGGDVYSTIILQADIASELGIAGGSVAQPIRGNPWYVACAASARKCAITGAGIMSAVWLRES